MYLHGRPGVQDFLFCVVEARGKAEQNCAHPGISLAFKTVVPIALHHGFSAWSLTDGLEKLLWES